MPRDDTLDGVDAETIATDRLETHVLTSGDPDGQPVCFLHGNVTSSRFWEPTLAALPDDYYAFAPDLRGYGDSETKPVDATRGLGDFVDDLAALLSDLEVTDPLTLVGWSNGGGVAMAYAIEEAAPLHALVLVNPLSPYGFGGTKDREGTPCFPDYAGSGGGLANEDLVAGLRNREREATGDAAPLTILRSLYVDPSFEYDPDREESFLTGMLDTATGPEQYPGDATESDNWPGLAPGDRGVNNAISPKYCDLSGIVHRDEKPPVLWLRGENDRIVSNESMLDLGALGRLGQVPDWPGEDVFPPQPMVDQTRAVLEEYAAAGGEYEEVVFEDVGHSPHVEAPETFRDHLADALEGA